MLGRVLPTTRALLSRRALAPRRALCGVPGGGAPSVLALEDEMPLPVRRRVAGLASLHADFEGLEETHLEKMRELELEFETDLNVVYTRRQELVAGSAEPTDEEVRRSPFYDELRDALEGDGSEAPVAESPIGVPLFWPIAMRYCGSLHDIDGFEISEKDWSVLEHLEEVRTEPWEPAAEQAAAGNLQQFGGGEGTAEERAELVDIYASEPGYALHFRFAVDNPHLESPELSIFCYGHGEVADATVPKWTAGQDPTTRVRVKKVKKKKGCVEKQSVVKPVNSFFRIFATPDPEEGYEDNDTGRAPPGDEAMSVAALQEELVARLKEDLLPRAASYYVNALHGAGPDAEEESGDWE